MKPCGVRNSAMPSFCESSPSCCRAASSRFFVRLQRLDALQVLVVLEGRPDRRADFADEFLHVAVELPAAAAGQPEQARLGGVGEVMHIAPVCGRRAAMAFFLEQTRDDGMASAAGLAEQEQVVAALAHVETEMQGLDRARVDQRRVELGQLAGTGEGQLRWIAGGIQGFGFEFGGGGHRVLYVPGRFSVRLPLTARGRQSGTRATQVIGASEQGGNHARRRSPGNQEP